MKYEELPHDDVMERSIFGLLLFDPQKVQYVIDGLLPTDFYVPAHQQIWQAMVDLFREGKEIDFPNLRMQLKNAEVDPKPALEVLAEALSDEIRDYHLEDFIKEIKNKSLLRQIIKTSKSHTYTAQMPNAKATDLLVAMEKDTLSIADKTIDTQPVTADGIMKQVQEDIERGMREGWKGFNTGFSALDENTGGLIPSQVWIIGANTGTGKTFHILQILLNVLRQGGSVVLFSTEMDRKLNMLRLLGNIAGLGAIQIMRNRLSDEEHEQLEKAKQELQSYKNRLVIYDNVYTVEEIRLKTKKHILSGGANVVAVDYLQNLKGKEEDGIYEKMAEASIDLYRMAQELKPTLIIGSQISQAAANHKGQEAIGYKGAGEIAAVSDVGLWIERVKGSSSDRLIQMKKVRHGIASNAKSRIEFPSGRVIDVDALGEQTSSSTDVKGQIESTDE